MWRRSCIAYSVFLVAFLAFDATEGFAGILPQKTAFRRPYSSSIYQSSFSSDGAEYSSKDSMDPSDDDEASRAYDRGYSDDQDETPTVELQPVPMSKNGGNRFVAFVWDRDLNAKGGDALDLHSDRIALTEDHVMFCRKTNLYNETFNTESMVDIVWSLPMYVGSVDV
jgi:hypothetical protein